MEGNTINTKSFQDRGWLKLDNAAKLFPAIVSEELTSVFRITAFLKKPVSYSKIKEAVEITSERFPYFSVSLRSGFFWHYLEFNNQPPRIQPEEDPPCTAFALKRKDETLYRVLISANRISVEFVHILTDGSGALEYLKSLLYTYLILSGNSISQPEGIILPETPFNEEEIEDGYKRFFRKLPPPEKMSKAWHLPFGLNNKPRMKVIVAEMKADDLIQMSRKHNVSLTEYFVSVYLLSLQNIYLKEGEKKRKQRFNILRIEVPVNMRNKLPSKTMRNFSLFVMPGIDLRLGSYTFEEILKTVHYYMQTSSEVKQILRFLSSNVSYEKLLLVRVMPLFIKRIAIAAIYRGLGSKRCTGIFTNMGAIELPDDMEEMIDSLLVVPPPPNEKVKVNCAMLSYKNIMRISFCNITQSHELERQILKHLSNSGIHIKLIRN